MNDRQLRMLRWVSTLLEQLAKPEIRTLFTDPELEMMLKRAKMLVNAELALETTSDVEAVRVSKDLEELEKIYSL